MALETMIRPIGFSLNANDERRVQYHLDTSSAGSLTTPSQ